MVIYLVRNNVNGKCYIGQTTKSIKWRWREHRRCHRRFVLHKAIRKYGAGNFTITELAQACSIECLNYLEPLFIAAYNTLAPRGYNLDSGGRNNKAHPDTVTKMSMAKKGKRFTAEHRAKIGAAQKGRTLSLEQRARQSSTMRGRQVTVEEYQRIYDTKHTRKGRSPYCRRGLHLLTGRGRCKECQRVYEKQRPLRIRPPRRRNR